jgi:hypothetical protein
MRRCGGLFVNAIGPVIPINDLTAADSRRPFNMRHSSPRSLLLLPLVLATAGCPTKPAPLVTEIRDTQCELEFANVHQKAERDRIRQVLLAYAKKGTLQELSPLDQPTFKVAFQIDRLHELDDLHTELVYPLNDPTRSTAAHGNGAERAFNNSQQKFTMRYDTIQLGGGLAVIVRFTVTPGTRLFYIPASGKEEEISKLVTANGTVELPTTIGRGQDYIYARTVAGQVKRYIRINVYTQAVEELSASAYPKQQP